MLKNTFKDEIPKDGKRKYGIVDSAGNYIYRDVQIVRTNTNTQDGDKYGAADVNEERTLLNQLGNSNLLINGDFQVWQRGTKFENIASDRYTADRWMLRGNAQEVMMLKKETNGASIIGTVMQKIESCLRGKIVTLSAKIDGHVFSVTTDVISDTWKSYPLNENGKNISFAIQTTSTNITIVEVYLHNIVSKVAYLVEWVKCDYGNNATNYTPRTYVEELALCQRYYQIYSYLMLRNLTNTLGVLYAGFPLRSELRAKPTYRSTIETAQGSDISSDLADYYINNNCVNYIQMQTRKLDCIMIKALSLDAEIY